MNDISGNDARKLESSRPMPQTRLRCARWTIGALLLIIAISIGCASTTASRKTTAAAQGRQLQLVSTAWSPFYQRATATVRPRSGRRGSRTRGDHR